MSANFILYIDIHKQPRQDFHDPLLFLKNIPEIKADFVDVDNFSDPTLTANCIKAMKEAKRCVVILNVSDGNSGNPFIGLATALVDSTIEALVFLNGEPSGIEKILATHRSFYRDKSSDSILEMVIDFLT